MQKKRLWAVAGTVFAILLLALLVIPSFIDWSKYQSVARDRVRTATGYDLTIGGKLSMALLPTPHATVTDVTVTKPVTEKTEPFLTFEQADVRVALLPLLLGRVEVASVTLEKPVVTLIKFQEGVDNYTPVKGAAQAPGQTEGGEPAAAEVTTAEGDTIAINKFHIKDGRITMNDVTAGTTREIGIEEMTVKADTLTGPFDGEAKSRWARRALKSTCPPAATNRAKPCPCS